MSTLALSIDADRSVWLERVFARGKDMLIEVARRGGHPIRAQQFLADARDADGIRALILLVEIEELLELLDEHEVVSPLFIAKVKSTHWVRPTRRGRELLDARRLLPLEGAP